MTAHEFGQRVDDDVGAVFEGADEIWRGQGVVDHQWNARVVGYLRDALDIERQEIGIADRLGVNELRLLGVIARRTASGVGSQNSTLMPSLGKVCSNWL